jgi:hypothetical protein
MATDIGFLAAGINGLVVRLGIKRKAWRNPHRFFF